MKYLLKSCTAALASLSFVTQVAAAEPLKALGKGEGAVSIVAWAGYIERGETDKSYDWVTAFEKETGCKVSVKTAATSDEMVALMNEGGFDLVTASGDASLRLDRRQARPADQHRSHPELQERRSRACRMRPGTPSTTSTTAFPTSGDRTC